MKLSFIQVFSVLQNVQTDFLFQTSSQWHQKLTLKIKYYLWFFRGLYENEQKHNLCWLSYIDLHNCEHAIQFDLGCLQEVSEHEPRLRNGMKFFLGLYSYFGTTVFSSNIHKNWRFFFHKMAQKTYYVCIYNVTEWSNTKLFQPM